MSEDLSSDSPFDTSFPVGALLAQMRRRRGWTGIQLGQATGMSQAKISKIETGAIAPTPADVERLALALGASADVTRRLREQVEHAPNQMTDWRFRYGGLSSGQRELARLEATGREVRIFQHGAISGLLQTTEYARVVFTASKSRTNDDSSGTVPDAVSARIRRQELLTDHSKNFVFLMTESVLQYPICSPIDMASQILRIREVSRQENVTVRFIPPTQRMTMPLVHNFYLLDDRLVLIDLFNTFLTSRGRADIRFYHGLFESFAQEAVVEIDTVLDRYYNIYLDLARDPRG